MCNWSAVAGQWHWLIEKEAVLCPWKEMCGAGTTGTWPVLTDQYRYITTTNSEKALVTSSKGAASFCIHLAEQFCRRSINASYHFSLLFQYLLIMCVKMLFISLLVFPCPQPLMCSFFKWLLLLKHWKVAVFPRMPTQFLSSWREKKQDCLCSVRQKNCGQLYQ